MTLNPVANIRVNQNNLSVNFFLVFYEFNTQTYCAASSAFLFLNFLHFAIELIFLRSKNNQVVDGMFLSRLENRFISVTVLLT